MEKISNALRGVPGCHVNIMTPETPEAKATALELHDIFGACGFPSRIINSGASLAQSLELQSNCQNAAAALAVQTALHDGGFRAPLLIDDQAPMNTVLIRLGNRGLL